MGGNQIERRRAPRANTDLAIQLSDRGTRREAKVKDLSSNGLCCAYAEPLGEMTLIGIGLALPGAETVHELQGAVVRCDKLRGVAPPTYEIAVYFTEIGAETRRAIAAYVDGQLAQT